MVVTDDLSGLPPEIAQARLQRKMMSDVWSGLQRACEGVYIGGVVAACREATLREAGITHIVNVTPNEKDFFPLSFTYLRVPVNDTASGRLDRHWEAAFTFIASAVANGGRVMVHCSAGVSRSASLVIYWMMRKYRMTLMAAYRALKNSRGCIAPNFTFWQQLVDAEKQLAGVVSCSVLEYKKIRLMDAFPACSGSQADAALASANNDMDTAAAFIGAALARRES